MLEIQTTNSDPHLANFGLKMLLKFQFLIFFLSLNFEILWTDTNLLNQYFEYIINKYIILKPIAPIRPIKFNIAFKIFSVSDLTVL